MLEKSIWRPPLEDKRGRGELVVRTGEGGANKRMGERGKGQEVKRERKWGKREKGSVRE